MNNLFEFNNNSVTINPILLSIKEFDLLWNRDKSKDKSKVRKELTYIYGMLSNNEDNIWVDYMDLREREKNIIEDLFDEKWYPDELVTKAMDKYKQRYPKSPGEELLEASKLAMLKVKEYITNVDFNEVDNNGRQKNNPKIVLEIAKQATDTYLKIEDTIIKIQNNKKIQNEKIRGGGEKAMFEDEIEEDF